MAIDSVKTAQGPRLNNLRLVLRARPSIHSLIYAASNDVCVYGACDYRLEAKMIQTEVNKNPAVTIFYDGGCPMCDAEITLYKKMDTSQCMHFIDITDPSADMPPDLDKKTANAGTASKLPRRLVHQIAVFYHG